jgi:hypothetical protein
MIKDALKYLEPNAAIPIDMETTIMLVNALKEALAQRTEQEPCVHAKNPKGCYRVRCQVGDKCVDDEMSFRTTPPQPEQEPVAFASHGVINWIADKQFQHEADLYTTPPQRKPLTDEEMKKIWYALLNIMGWYSFQEIARAIEAAHGIKENT